MSLPARIALRPASARLPLAAMPRRTLRSSAIARGGDAHQEPVSPTEEYTEESFSGPGWRKVFLGGVAAFVVYRLTEVHGTPDVKNSSIVRRLIEFTGRSPDEEHHLTSRRIQEERNLQHLDLARRIAEDQLFLLESEKPPIRKIRYRGLLDQASPHCLPVGVYSQAKPFKPEESAASQEPKGDDEQSEDETPQKNSKKQKEPKEADEE